MSKQTLIILTSIIGGILLHHCFYEPEEIYARYYASENYYQDSCFCLIDTFNYPKDLEFMEHSNFACKDSAVQKFSNYGLLYNDLNYSFMQESIQNYLFYDKRNK